MICRLTRGPPSRCQRGRRRRKKTPVPTGQTRAETGALSTVAVGSVVKAASAKASIGILRPNGAERRRRRPWRMKEGCVGMVARYCAVRSMKERRGGEGDVERTEE